MRVIEYLWTRLHLTTVGLSLPLIFAPLMVKVCCNSSQVTTCRQQWSLVLHIYWLCNCEIGSDPRSGMYKCLSDFFSILKQWRDVCVRNCDEIRKCLTVLHMRCYYTQFNKGFWIFPENEDGLLQSSFNSMMNILFMCCLIWTAHQLSSCKHVFPHTTKLIKSIYTCWCSLSHVWFCATVRLNPAVRCQTGILPLTIYF